MPKSYRIRTQPGVDKSIKIQGVVQDVEALKSSISSWYPELKNVIRHELEHVSQQQKGSIQGIYQGNTPNGFILYLRSSCTICSRADLMPSKRTSVLVSPISSNKITLL